MRSLSRRRCLGPLFGVVVPSLALLACSTDTSALVRRDGSGESGGMGGMATSGGGGASTGGTEHGGSTSDVPPADGVGTLSVVHGVVDGGNLFVCLSDATTRAPLLEDRPEPPSGIAYGSFYRVDIDLDSQLGDVRVDLITLIPEAAEGRTCSDLVRQIDESSAPLGLGDAGVSEPSAADAGVPDAGPPAIFVPTAPNTPRRAGVAAIATEALRAGAQDVLVATGCATPQIDPVIEGCGSRDAFGSNLALPFVELGREQSQPPPFLGIQLLAASRAMGPIDVVLQGMNQSSQSVRLANLVQFGALRPRAVTSVLEPVAVELHVAGSKGAAYVQTWEQTLAGSGVPAVTPGHNYLLVYIGPAPQLPEVAGFAPPRFVLVPGR